MITDKQMERYEELAQDLESTTYPNYDVSAAARKAVPPLVAEVRYLRRQVSDITSDELNQRIRTASDARSARLRYALEQYEAYFATHDTDVPEEIALLANKAMAAYDFDDVVLDTPTEAQ